MKLEIIRKMSLHGISFYDLLARDEISYGLYQKMKAKIRLGTQISKTIYTSTYCFSM